MKKLLLTTALVAAFATAASAQTATNRVTVPEGYTQFQDRNLLTFDRLRGANVYDVRGESIGSISDIVLGTAGAGAAGQAGAGTMQGQTGAVQGQAGTGATGTVQGQAGTGATGTVQPGTDTTAGTVPGQGGSGAIQGQAGTLQGQAGTGTIQGAGNATDTGAQGNLQTQGTGTVVQGQGTGTVVQGQGTVVQGDGTATGVGQTSVERTADEANREISAVAARAIEDINRIAQNARNNFAQGTAPGTGGLMQDGTTAGAVAPGTPSGTQVVVPEGAGITHVIVDIGGFLGMGVHTVALPFEALEIYASANNDLRIYVPWSEEQLRDLRQYDANDPDTLGRMPTNN
ncbi:MAG: hypothetical protein Q8K20_18440 [Gemmobacter sp.]|nr:hypothetical protein [Gemmobacter sp.]